MSTDHSLVTMQSHSWTVSRTAIKCNMLNLFESKKLKTVSVIEIGVSPSIMVEKNNKTYVRWQNWTKTTSVHSFEKFEKNTTDLPDNLLNRDHFDARTDYWVEVFADWLIWTTQTPSKWRSRYKKSIPESVTCRLSPALSKIPQESKVIESCSAS